MFLGPLIDKIVAICQSKAEQIDWIQKINQQLGNNVSTIATASQSVSWNLGKLSDYFAHLVCKGVITRSLLKLILYTQYINNIDTSNVVRRNLNESYRLCSPCKYKQIGSKETQCDNSYNLSTPKHCSSVVVKEDGKIVYGKKMLFTPVTAKACQDLTISTLYKEDTIDYNYNPNMLNCKNLKPKYLTIPLFNSMHSKNDSDGSDNCDSTFSLDNLKKTCSYVNCFDIKKDTELSQDFQYLKFNDHNSLRSSDSGLADITNNQQSPLPVTEISENNSDNLCKSISSIHINSCIFEDDNFLPSHNGSTFRSQLYAHWWLKKILPESNGSDSGKNIICFKCFSLKLTTGILLSDFYFYFIQINY